METLRFPLGQRDDGMRSGSASFGAAGAADTLSWCLSFLFHTGWWAAFSFKLSPILLWVYLHCSPAGPHRAARRTMSSLSQLGFLMDKIQIAPISALQLTNHLMDCEGISHILVHNGAWSKKHSGLVGLLSETRL